MSTRNSSISGSLPAGASPAPLSASEPVPAKLSRPARPFASVLEQATKPAHPHSRSTKSSGKNSRERGDAGAASARSVPTQAPKPVGSGAKGPKAAGEVEVEGGAPLPHSPAPSLPHSLIPSLPQSSQDALPEEALPVLAQEEEKEVAPDAALNVIAFPISPVIVPFPVAPPPEVAGERGSGRGGEGEGVAHSLTSSLPHLPTPSLPQSSQEAFSGEGNEAELSDAQEEGMDVVKLGLRPVRESERAANIEVVDFGGKSTAAVPEGKILAVNFREAGARGRGDEPELAESPKSQLPGGAVQGVVTAAPVVGTRGVSGAAGAVVGSSPDMVKPASGAGLPVVTGGTGTPAAVALQGAGTSAAKQGIDMKAFSNTERLSGLSGGNPAGAAESDAASSQAAAGTAVDAAANAPGHGQTNDFTSRIHPATDWVMGQAGRTVSGSDQSAPATAPTIDAAATVDRIANLVQREAALVRPHSSDSMAVVLRPDENTELFVHLTHRNGQVEATVRCERGDTAQLGALWSQLQETLSQQKVRLAPLQESPSNHSNFNQSAGSDLNGDGRGPQQRTPREQQFMDERPAPASSASTTTPHVRGGGDSRHRRVTTSRPGWESWA